MSDGDGADEGATGEGGVDAVPEADREFEADARGRSVDDDLLAGRADGVFRTLAEGAIADHIEADEQPHYVLQNRKGGLTVERPEGTIERAPSRRYRAFCVVTDRRVLFLVGRTDDDERTAVPYGAITNVTRSGGLLHDELRINTGSDVYVFGVEKSTSDREIDAAVAYVTERAAAAGDGDGDGPDDDGEVTPEDAAAVDRASELVRNARDDSVTMDRLTARDEQLLGLLQTGEQPHYHLRGSGHRGIEVEHADGEVVRHGQADAGLLDSLDQLDRENHTVVTDRRVIAYLPKTTGTVEYAVALSDLREAAIEPGDGRNPRLALSTGERALRLEVHDDQHDRLTAALGYVRETAGLDGGDDSAGDEDGTADGDGDGTGTT